MVYLSRRDLLGSIAAAGVTSLATGSCVAATAIDTKEPPLSAADRRQAVDMLLAYFKRTGPKLFRNPGGYLHYPTISPSQPGKAYSAELWDWDTYWTARGLFQLAKLSNDKELHQKACEHAQGSLYSFFDGQSAEGRIPIMISIDHEDFFGSTKKQPRNPCNQAKPVMGQLALLVADELNDAAWFAPRFESLLRFYEAWDAENLSSIGLYVWGNDVAIGDDNDPTTFGRPEFSSANVMLNCLFYQDLRAAAELAQRLERPKDAKRLQAKADELGATIQECCWDPRDRFYYTVDVQCKDRRSELLPNVPQGMSMSWRCLPLRIQMVTGFMPLWCGLATPQQAGDLLKRNYFDDDRFRANAGIRTLSSQETMYSLTSMSGNPSNFLGPVWIIANYFVWKPLRGYGFISAANELADKTIHLLASDIATSGTLNEYYHPDTGQPLSHSGFIDWNLLVLEMI